MKTIDICLIGCGAITELQYVPAIKALQATEGLRVTGLIDPSPARIDAVRAHFPDATALSSISEADSELAIVASPAAYHGSQAVEALERGMHVLTEKPMAATVEEAERMIETSKRTGKRLAVGHFRRFFPTTQVLKEIVQHQPLGRAVGYEIAEGGPFGWAATSATFFQKRHSYGGVLHDHGAHVLDLVIHWFGEPERIEYMDDNGGGLETNCVVRMWHAGGIEGTVRLSREWPTANRNHFRFARGWVGWNTGSANLLDLCPEGCSTVLKSHVTSPAKLWELPVSGMDLHSYSQAFTEQLAQFLRSVQDGDEPRVTGEEAIKCMRLIESCYQNRKDMVAA